jgi:hypothetical protein
MSDQTAETTPTQASQPASLADLNQTPPAGAEPPAGAGQPGEAAPAGGVPEWVREKYRAAENPVEAQARAYAELETRLGRAKEDLRAEVEQELRGARPEAADAYTLPEDLTAPDEQVSAFRAKAHELGMTQEQFEGMARLYAETSGVDIEAEKAKLGDDADTRIQQLSRWGSRNIPADLHDAAMSVMRTADGFKVIEALMKAAGAPALPSAEHVEPPQALTRDKLNEMMDDERYASRHKRDPAFVKQVEEYAARLAASRQGQRSI